ncbi:hypothetical protein ABZZ36_42475 [Actinacidiphila glaucinigra]
MAQAGDQAGADEAVFMAALTGASSVLAGMLGGCPTVSRSAVLAAD